MGAGGVKMRARGPSWSPGRPIESLGHMAASALNDADRHKMLNKNGKKEIVIQVA